MSSDEPVERAHAYVTRVETLLRRAEDEQGQQRSGTLREALTLATLALVERLPTRPPTGPLLSAWEYLNDDETSRAAAYRKAASAVCEAAAPVVGPSTTAQEIIDRLRADPAAWRLILSPSDQRTGLATLTGMLELLQQAVDRAADLEAPRQDSQEIAEEILHVAALLVAWFTSGAVRRG